MGNDMKLPPLYFNIFWCSLAVLWMSVNCNTGIPSRNKPSDLQEDLNKLEIAIQNFLSHDGSFDKDGTTQARVTDTSFGSTNQDKQAHSRHGKFEERLTGSRQGVPVAIDMAFQMQKQKVRNQKGHRKFVPELDEDNEKQEKQKKPLDNESIQLDSSGNDNGDDEKSTSSTEERINNNLVKDGKDEIKNDKNDIDVSLHEPRENTFIFQNEDLFIPAIDLAFRTSNSPTIKNPTTTTTAKPTKLYWPPTTTSISTPNQICRSKIDLGFLVEASKSVARTGPGNYRRLMNFVKHVALKFAIGPKATRIGVISYANRPILLMGFNDGENILDVLKYLNLPCHHCWNAQTGLALSFAESYLYGCSCNVRQRVLVVVTDGSSSDGVHIPSRILKQKGVKIIGIGVGRYFNIDQLNTMASRPVRHNVFTGDFSRIHHVTNEIVTQICNGADGSMVPSSPSPCQCP